MIRFSRFESALKEVFTAAKDTESGRQSKAELQKHVMEMLGGFYMHYHSIGFGPSVQLEDAQAALRAYWRICEKRINEDVESAVDMMLLQVSPTIFWSSFCFVVVFAISLQNVHLL